MGLFDFLKKSTKTVRETQTEQSEETARHERMQFADSSSIPADERPFYNPDEYYTLYSFPEHSGGAKVITFDERKGSSFPSPNGLYVAEILLLSYVDKGNYPNPKNGYPGLWWFQYGIRDVGGALRSLEARGYIEWAPKSKSLSKLKIAELKEILKNAGLATDGKKEDLIQRIASNVSEDQYQIFDYVPKYQLTEEGQSELKANGYVPYMHTHPNKTTEDERFGKPFNVWSINRLFGGKDASNWKQIVGDTEEQLFGTNKVSADSGEKEAQTAEEVKAYLKENKAFIVDESKKSGNGFEEEMAGMSLKKANKDKEALVQFSIAARKKFDAPALYKNAAILFRKYKMLDEELAMLDKGLSNVSKKNAHWAELAERREKVRAMIEKQG